MTRCSKNERTADIRRFTLAGAALRPVILTTLSPGLDGGFICSSTQ
jgi:hypothetical protein